MEKQGMGKEKAISKYLQDVKLGYGYVTLDKIADDIFYEELSTVGVNVSDVVKYALNAGWTLLESGDEGWMLCKLA